MEFSLKIVTDGQNSTIHINGLGDLKNHKEEFQKTIYEAIAIAIGLEPPKDSCFEPLENPIISEPLEKEKPIDINYEYKKIEKAIDKEGTITNIEDVHISGELGHETLVAKAQDTTNSNEIKNNASQDKFKSMKNRNECDIILELFIENSTNYTQLTNKTKILYEELINIQKK